MDIYSSGYSPNPESALDVLAFVLCPAAAFATGAGEDELEAVAEIMGPAKAQAVRRWHAAVLAGRQN